MTNPVTLHLASDPTQPGQVLITSSYKPALGTPISTTELVALDMLNFATGRCQSARAVVIYATTTEPSTNLAQQLAGERNVLANLLREADQLLPLVDDLDDREGELAHLRTRIAQALAGLYVHPADQLFQQEAA
jgi:hypothetical protein